jgi:hypothetical protein
MEALVLSLLLWLSANSDYEVAQFSLPQVRLLSPQAMTALCYEQAGAGPDAPADAATVDARIQGYFSGAESVSGTIYLVHPQDTPGAASYTDPTDNPLFRERLLHELVHFAQHASGAYARFQCPVEGEFAAYRLGAIYLRQLGVPDPMPGRVVWMRRFSAC